MKKNIGLADQGIRIFIALVLLFAGYLYSEFFGIWQWLFYIIAIILIITALTGYCCIYDLFKINTKKIKRKK